MNHAAAPFTWLGTAAIVGAGLVAAAIAHSPTQPLVWMVAYLVLVVGVVQCVLGEGQARLAWEPPAASMVWSQWLLFNLGNAGVIGGTLARHFGLVAGGTVLFAVALAWFALKAWRGRRGAGRVGYLLLVLAMLASSLVGIFLSAMQGA